MKPTKNITAMMLFFVLASIALAVPVIEEGFMADGVAGLLKKESDSSVPVLPVALKRKGKSPAAVISSMGMAEQKYPMILPPRAFQASTASLRIVLEASANRCKASSSIRTSNDAPSFQPESTISRIFSSASAGIGPSFSRGLEPVVAFVSSDDPAGSRQRIYPQES